MVLDTCGYFPRDVAASAEHLQDRADRYIFVSSLSVFADAFTTPGIDESGRLRSAGPEDTEVTGENYGGLKALCERAAEHAMPGRLLVVRPGLIVGPHDQSDRFTYWAARLGEGGDILAPAPPSEPVQLIDVRDLAEWMVRMAAAGKTGIYNACGPERELSLGTALERGEAALGGSGDLVWVDGLWLVERGVKPWTELPLWVPNAQGFARFDVSKGIASGLTFRTLEETFRDTAAWARTRPGTHEWKGGLSKEREAELLARWRDRA